MNPRLVDTIIKLKKTNPLVAKLLARPVRKQIKVNLEKIEEQSKKEGKILVPGKVLSMGDLDKKLKIVGLSASEKAIEKIKSKHGEFIPISEEIKKNPELKNLVLIK